jgi:hypothetical protein
VRVRVCVRDGTGGAKAVRVDDRTTTRVVAFALIAEQELEAEWVLIVSEVDSLLV